MTTISRLCNWHRFVLRCRMRSKVVLFVLFTAVLVVYHLFKWKIICTNLEITQHVNTLCGLYEDGKATGGLCRDLCRTKQLTPISCQTLHIGKEVVFSADWNGRKVFIKSQENDFTKNIDDQVFWVDTYNIKHFPSMSEFENLLRSMLATNLNISVPDVIETLWYTKTDKLSQSEMNNIWALAHDDEYIYSKVYEAYQTFPKVLGTCGSYYAVESLEQLKFPVFNKLESFAEYAKRVEMSVKILEFIDEMAYIFPHPLYLCDMKLEHFGVGKDKILKFLDIDAMYLKPALNKILSDGTQCESHDDCSYFSCASRCNLATHKCDSEVTNNNLQSVCEKVLYNNGRGYLTSPHMNKRTERLLEKCSFPSITDDVKTATSEEVGKALKDALLEVLQFVEH